MLCLVLYLVSYGSQGLETQRPSIPSEITGVQAIPPTQVAEPKYFASNHWRCQETEVRDPQF